MRKKSLSTKESIIIASTLFGMFFGAGNIIFPVSVGQLAGSHVLPAAIGFCITAVTIPVLAVIAIANTGSENLLELASRAGKGYGKYFTLALYLVIGPLVAIPRCGSLSFTMGLEPVLGSGAGRVIGRLVFTLIFFIIVLFFSLRPGQITTWIGKIINPLFLLCLIVLAVTVLTDSNAVISELEPAEAYKAGAFPSGLIGGYGTMDAIAGLVFGIVIIDTIRDLGVDDDREVAKEAAKTGLITAVLMAAVYVLIILVGAKSRDVFDIADNGGTALAEISAHYLGGFGQFILAATVIFACLKTAIGLVVSSGEMFVRLVPGKLNYRGWALVFTVLSLILSNIGLSAILRFTVPLLSLLYPPAIVLIILALSDKLFGGKRDVYLWASIGAFIPSIFGFLKELGIDAAASLGGRIFPLFDIGFGWVTPALIGAAIGLALAKAHTGEVAK